MPYTIAQNDAGDYCVYKTDGGDTLGCHPTKEAAQSQIDAIYASESKSLPYQIGHDNIEDVLPKTLVNEPRYALIVTSNAYEDREGEIVKEKALSEYVEAQWQGDKFVGQQPLLVWHGGDPVGDIVYADMYGPFLVEVAKELPDGPVDLSRNGDAPYVSTVKAVWDALETANEELGASHEFLYAVKDREDRVYERIVKLETSALPRSGAGNGYTFFSVVRPVSGAQE